MWWLKRWGSKVSEVGIKSFPDVEELDEECPTFSTFNYWYCVVLILPQGLPLEASGGFASVWLEASPGGVSPPTNRRLNWLKGC